MFFGLSISVLVSDFEASRRNYHLFHLYGVEAEIDPIWKLD
jgi:hypothetical protein